MTKKIAIAQTDKELMACFDAFKALRPHIEPERFLEQIRRQQSQSYQVLALSVDGMVNSVAGFRMGEYLPWGKALYLDDLSTLPEARGKGYAGALLDWLINHAKSEGCQSFHLDSGHTRFDAHRLYLNKGFKIRAHHFALQLDE